jgi:ATP-dependent Zn protease
MVIVDERRRVALHESCHAFVAALLEIRVTKVSLDPPATIFADWTADRNLIARRLIAGLAPCMAQLTFGVDHWLEHDMEMAWRLAPLFDPIDPARYLRRLGADLQEIVAENEEAIEAVAEALLERGQLSGDQVRQIVDSHRLSSQSPSEFL